MVRGVGIDVVDAAEQERLLGAFPERVFAHIFTERELADARGRRDRAGVLAGRFGVKEAVFKVVAPLLPEKSFDLRIVATATAADGTPRLEIAAALRESLDRAEVDEVLVSTSRQGDLVVALAVAERRTAGQ